MGIIHDIENIRTGDFGEGVKSFAKK